jgi:mono/diheme cytochrome c family protein
MLRRIAVTTLIVGVVGLAGFALVSRRPAITPVARPDPASFAPQSVARGELVAAEGHCASCHTGPGGQPFAGGYGVRTPFGIIYGTNITPDPTTGIGEWSLAAFTRAMREGVSRNGDHLFPAFPYTAYTEMGNDDIMGLYAYLMTRQPVSATAPPNTVPFPLSVRLFQEGWKILFFSRKPYHPDATKSAAWNRGAYLTEAVSDCGGCHTPRNALGAERLRAAYTGTVVDDWIAPPLTPTNPSPVPWTEDELFRYLRTGEAHLHGAAIAATMTPVIRDALALPIVPDSDVRAIALYFSDVDHAAARASDVDAIVSAAAKKSTAAAADEDDPDAHLYTSACLSCHYNAGTSPLATRPDLALNSALALPEPTNFIAPVLRGIASDSGAPGLVMPAYASSLTDAEVARLAAYLRRTRTTHPPWNDLEHRVAAARRELAAPH